MKKGVGASTNLQLHAYRYVGKAPERLSERLTNHGLFAGRQRFMVELLKISPNLTKPDRDRATASYNVRQLPARTTRYPLRPGQANADGDRRELDQSEPLEPRQRFPLAAIAPAQV